MKTVYMLVNWIMVFFLSTFIVIVLHILLLYCHISICKYVYFTHSYSDLGKIYFPIKFHYLITILPSEATETSLIPLKMTEL